MTHGEVVALVPLFLASLTSALVPVVNAELVVVAAALASPPQWAAAIALVGAVGQVTGKIALYAAGRAGRAAIAGRRATAVQGLATRLEGRPARLTATILVSAVIGLPPFLLMSVAAGILRMRLVAFLFLGILGRFVRFFVLASLPGLL